MCPILEILPYRLAHEVRSATHPLLVWVNPEVPPKNGQLPMELMELASELSGEMDFRATTVKQDSEWGRCFPFWPSSALALFRHGTPIATFDLATPPRVLSSCLKGLLAEYADPATQKPQSQDS
jgi:hypothetical protein